MACNAENGEGMENEGGEEVKTQTEDSYFRLTRASEARTKLKAEISRRGNRIRKIEAMRKEIKRLQVFERACKMIHSRLGGVL